MPFGQYHIWCVQNGFSMDLPLYSSTTLRIFVSHEHCTVWFTFTWQNQVNFASSENPADHVATIKLAISSLVLKITLGDISMVLEMQNLVVASISSCAQNCILWCKFNLEQWQIQSGTANLTSSCYKCHKNLKNTNLQTWLGVYFLPLRFWFCSVYMKHHKSTNPARYADHNPHIEMACDHLELNASRKSLRAWSIS